MIEKLKNFIESPKAVNFILAIILFNAALLGLETSPRIMERFGHIILMLDHLCLSIFVIELLIKLTVYRFKFFKEGWNVFDFVIILIALVPAAQGLSVLRALRILRLLRVVSVSPSLRRVVEGFIKALPGMGSVVILMGLIFYVSSVIATKLFADTHTEFFGSLGQSSYSLFQIMTLESWSMGIVRPVMETYPYAWAFFIPFIMITTFSVVNLLVGLIVNSMQDVGSQDAVDETMHHRDELMKRLDEIEKQINNLADKK